MQPASQASEKNLPDPANAGDIEDPILRKLRAAIDGYRGRIAAWEEMLRPIAAKQNTPSNTTLLLFGLGVLLCIAVNALSLRGRTPFHELVASNLGCVALFAIAAISLFYDRVVKGFGQELVLRRSSEQASEVTVQLHALSAIQVDLQFRVQRLSRDLNDLSLSIETQNEVAEDLKDRNLESAARLRDYEAKLADLRGSIMKEASRLNRFQHSIDRLESERRELELSIEAYTDHLFDIAAQRESISEEIASLQSTRQAARTAFAEESEKAKLDLGRLKDEMRMLAQERDAIEDNLESVKMDLSHLRELRSELQSEIVLLGQEQERNTATSIAALSQWQAKLDSVQQEYDRSRIEFDQLQAALRNATSERQGLGARIDQCQEAKEQLEDAIYGLLDQIREGRENLANIETAIRTEDQRLAERRDQAARDAVEAELRHQEHEALQAEIHRLAAVKDAMDLSIDELTNRLETRTTELRRKNNQLQEQAERLERLSEAIQRLTLRESEIRQSVDPRQSVEPNPPASHAPIANLPSVNGTTRGVHRPHFTPATKPKPQTSERAEELLEG